MLDLSFLHLPTDSMMLSDWHRTDDPWGAYLAGPGNPAHNLSNPQAETVYVPYGEGGPNVHGCDGGTAGCYAKSSNAMLTEWHKTDDPWGSYLDGPGNPATNLSNPQGGTVYVPYGEGGPDVHGCEAGTSGCYANTTHTSALGAGHEIFNNTEAPHNCVGGSEQGCIPDRPPVMDPSKTGMTHTLPAPASWYAHTEHTTALGAGEEFYNNMEAPHNCTGFSVGRCIPDNPPVMDPSKAGATAPTSALGAGHEIFNNTEAPHNCVGGSEQGCIPDRPPVMDPSKTGMTHTLPAPASWYAASDATALAPAKALAVPAATPAVATGSAGKTVAASPAHLLLPAHALLLAAVQGVAKGDLSKLHDDAIANVNAVTPVGGHYLRTLTAK